MPDSITDPAARNVDYVWMVNNVRGVTTERWFHAAGCRRWVTVQARHDHGYGRGLT